jgi:DNA-binding SARP family transcriptional activator
MTQGASEPLQRDFSATEYRLLGPVEVLLGGSPVRLGGAKQRAVLVLLLLDAGRVVSADRLVDGVWLDDPPRTARAVLQVYVSELRKLGVPIEARANGYVLEPSRGSLDVHELERLLTEGDEFRRAGRPQDAVERLRQAQALWRGPALAGLDPRVAAAEAARLEELRLLAVERRIDAELELGRGAELVPELEAIVAEHPLREALRRQLMLALYRSGRQAEALEAFRDTRRTFADELGIEPSRGLRELEAAILRQDAELEPGAAALTERRIVAACIDGGLLDGLASLAVALARRPPKELLLVRVVASPDGVAAAASELERSGTAGGTRTAAFASRSPYVHVARLAAEQDAELVLVDAPGGVDLGSLAPLLEEAPCDVAVVVHAADEATPGPVLVPFGGADHDWSAVELGAWLAGAWDAPLRLAGVVREDADASRLLASASIATQRALGVTAEPLLVGPGADGLLEAADESAALVFGLSERTRGGLGATRSVVVERSRVPVLLVRRGLRPGGLAPAAGRTRFTWTVGG